MFKTRNYSSATQTNLKMLSLSKGLLMLLSVATSRSILGVLSFVPSPCITTSCAKAKITTAKMNMQSTATHTPPITFAPTSSPPPAVPPNETTPEAQVMPKKTLPKIVQGGMGVRISSWKLAREVSKRGELGVISGTAMDVIFVRTLQDGMLFTFDIYAYLCTNSFKICSRDQ